MSRASWPLSVSALCLALSSCASPPPPQAAPKALALDIGGKASPKQQNAAQELSWSGMERLTVELAFISLAGCWHADPVTVAQTISGLMTRMLPRQEIVWGPAVHQPASILPGETTRLSDALALICRDRDSGEYSVVFRGTNTISAEEWLFQDFMVQKQVPWIQIQAGPAPDSALVSEGTATAVALRRELRPGIGAKGEGQSFVEALLGILERSEGPCVMHFTGHSLGGLLAPTMALWLVDYLEDTKREDLAAKLELDVYGYAAPPAGNGVFAAYQASRLEAKARRGGTSSRPASIRRYANDLDIAPRAWNEATMATLPALYGPDIVMQVVSRPLYELCLRLSQGKGYTQPGERIAVPSRIVQARGDLYLLEAAYQHFMPYLDMLEPSRKQTILREVIEPLAEFVSVKGLKPVDLNSLFETGD